MFLRIFPYWWPSFVGAHDHVITRNICLRVFRAKIRSGAIMAYLRFGLLNNCESSGRHCAALIFISPDKNGPLWISLWVHRVKNGCRHINQITIKSNEKSVPPLFHTETSSRCALVGAQGRRFNLWSAHAKRGYQAVRNERCSPTDRRRLMPKFNFLHTPWEDVASIALGHRK